MMNGIFSKFESDPKVMKESFVQTLQVVLLLQRFLSFDVVHSFLDTFCNHVGGRDQGVIFM